MVMPSLAHLRFRAACCLSCTSIISRFMLTDYSNLCTIVKMSFRRDLLNESFGKLTVTRHLPGDIEFCTCECGSYRHVRRQMLLSKSIKHCLRCAEASRRAPNRKSVEPEPEPENRPNPVPAAVCTGRLLNGFLLCGPDCPAHPMSARVWPRQVQPLILMGID